MHICVKIKKGNFKASDSNVSCIVVALKISRKQNLQCTSQKKKKTSKNECFSLFTRLYLLNNTQISRGIYI